MKISSKLIEDFNDFLLIERQHSINTAKSYTATVEQFAEFIGDIEVAKIQQDDIEKFKQKKILEKKINTSASEKATLSKIKSFFNFLVYDKILKVSPANNLTYPKKGLTIPIYLTVTEMQSIFLFLRTNHRLCTPINRLIIDVLYSAGLRVSELINLKISDIFFQNDLTNIHGKGGFTRIIPFDEGTFTHLEHYIENDRRKFKNNVHVFLTSSGKLIRREHIFKLVKLICVEVGITKNVSPHTFRHSIATHLQQNGMSLHDLKTFLGHKSIATTQIYTHTNIEHLRKTIDLL